MRIYLVRHGESTSDVKQRYDGDYDDHLTENGRNEADKVGMKLLDKNIEHIFSSSRIRAVETAETIAENLDCPFTIIEDLKEQDIYNAFKDLGINEPEEEYRRLGEVLSTRENTIQGTEVYEDFKARVMRGFNHILSTPYQQIVIVTHSGPIRCIFRELVKIGELKRITNGAIIELEKIEIGFKVTSMDGAFM